MAAKDFLVTASTMVFTTLPYECVCPRFACVVVIREVFPTYLLHASNVSVKYSSEHVYTLSNVVCHTLANTKLPAVSHPGALYERVTVVSECD